jgi:hypothetical protein
VTPTAAATRAATPRTAAIVAVLGVMVMTVSVGAISIAVRPR